MKYFRSAALWLVWGIIAVTFSGFARETGQLVPVGLRCDATENPLAVDSLSPQLSWRVESRARAQVQTAYQIIAASTRELLTHNHGDLWDSGKVCTNQTLGIAYQGAPLKSSQRVWWKVRVWDKAGLESSWSKVATWEMGLLSTNDWQAQWLNDGKTNPQSDEDFYKDDPAPLFRKEFSLPKKISRARLHISGLGYYEASLNGQRVGDHVLDPGWTRYSERVLYSTYDVTEQLRRDRNCLGVTLGNGWYDPLPLRLWGRVNLRERLPVGRPRFIARLEVEFADGTRDAVVSDSTWKVTDGPIRFNSIYLGERYDARCEIPGWNLPKFDDSSWRQPGIATESIGPLRAQTQPPIRVTKTLKAVKLTEPKPGVFIFDLGQNFSGWANLKLSAPAGTRVVLRYGELLNPDGTLNPLTSVAGQIKGARKNKNGVAVSVGGPGAPDIAWQSDTYIASGRGGERYTPRFTFHGFRYVEVTGLTHRPTLGDLTGLRLNSDVERVGTFVCSDERLNRLQQMCDWTFLSNIFSVQSDCPHRERFGYGGDIAATSEAFMMNYDMANFYAKAVRDWQDSALPDGMLTDTAPSVGIQYCGIGWAMVHPLLLRQLHQYYGDAALVAGQYATAKRWLDLETEKNPQLIIKSGLSDHESLVPTPSPDLVTPLFAASADNLSELARLLGFAADAEKYGQLAARIRAAYVNRFYNATNGQVGSGSQASQAFALKLGILPDSERPAALKFLLNDLQANTDGHLNTGIFGTKFLLDTLSQANHAERAFAIVNQTNFPGWGHMLENGATTLWEHWQGGTNTFSHNHPMFGSVSGWFYQWLGGIQPAPDAVGFDRIVICPQFVKELDWVKCRYDSVRGPIICNWKRAGERVQLEVTIPANTTALVCLPFRYTLKKNEANGFRSPENFGRYHVYEAGSKFYELGSGSYRFQLQN